MTDRYDAIVVGAGPNGLAAAIVLARAGRSVLVVEAATTIGGGTRTEQLTLPGFRHDVCSAIHPLALASPFLRTLPLAEHDLRFVQPPLPLAHPLADGTAVALHRSVEETAVGLGADASAYERLLGKPVRHWEAVVDALLGPPLRRPPRPLQTAPVAAIAVRSASSLAGRRFRGAAARALFAGNAAHSMLPLTAPGTAGFGLLLLTLGHAVGWPIAIGGSTAITEAMASYLRSLGGEIVTDLPVTSLAELPPSRVVLLDVTPRQVLAIAGSAIGGRYRQALARFRYGPGVFKVDYALSGPVPWTAPACRQAGTVHVGGALEEIARSEAAAERGEHAPAPFVLVAQQSLFDPSRAPAGQHTLWAYCHVPNGSRQDMTVVVERQIERFAPGFGATILARHAFDTRALEAYDANYVGGDINGGVADLRQLLARPVLRRTPYATPNPRLFLCSSSTPPGGGVHGMCGWFAAQAALRTLART